jgi:hypothetical protein
MAKKKRVRKPNDLSLAQLQRLVESKASELTDLKAKRAEVQKELDGLDRLIQQTEGIKRQKTTLDKKTAVGAATTGFPAKRKKKVAKTAKRTRAKNARSAKSYAEEILRKEPQGLPLNQLANKILASGYKSNSTSFKNTLYQSLYNARKAGKTFDYSDKTGRWTVR